VAGSAGGSDQDSISGINVTPLVDITLVLLIIFIATSIMEMKSELGVNLPKQASAADPNSKPPLMVQIEEDGTVKVGGKVVAKEDLLNAFKAAKAENDKVSASIMPAEKIDYGAVVDVVDLVRQAKITQFAMSIPNKDKDADK
jgi:biopolymer transport protein ExbD